MRGIAEGSGVDFNFFKRIHMIGQLTKGSCSMFGAWGNATTNGQTVQLRALDWVFIILCRISMDLIINIHWLQFIIHLALNSDMPGSIQVFQGGLEFYQESININLLFHKLEFHIQIILLERKVDLVIHLHLFLEMFFNGIKHLMNLFIECRLLKEHAI